MRDSAITAILIKLFIDFYIVYAFFSLIDPLHILFLIQFLNLFIYSGTLRIMKEIHRFIGFPKFAFKQYGTLTVKTNKFSIVNYVKYLLY